jgi:hypothetical protein
MQTSLRTITPQFTSFRITPQPELFTQMPSRQPSKVQVLRSVYPESASRRAAREASATINHVRAIFVSCQACLQVLSDLHQAFEFDVSDCAYKGSESRRSPSQPPMEGRIDTATAGSVSTVPQITRHALIEGQSRSGVKRDHLIRA